MLYSISHRTTYEYQTAVSYSHHIAHLRPRETVRQQVLDFAYEIHPQPTAIVPRIDYFGNPATFLAFESPHRELVVTSRCRIRVGPPTSPTPEETPRWEAVRDACASPVLTADSEMGEFLFDSPHITRRADFAAYARVSFKPGRHFLEALLDFNTRIFRDFTFDPRATTVATPLEEVFQKRRGVCQDFAHFGVACLRSIGLPARYVSGYLETVPPPGKPRLVGADVSHAWISAWCSGFGWIDIDPTNDLLCRDRHMTLAWGRDFSDVSPLRGVVVGGGGHSLRVAIDVAPVEEASS